MIWREYLLGLEATILQAIKVLEGEAAKIVLVVDGDDRLLGTVTDGDIRRGILSGRSVQSSVRDVMRSDPKCGHPGDSRETLIAKMRAAKIRQIPIVDGDHRVIGLQLLENLEDREAKHDNWVVLMAGGLGTRLHPLTETTPKPLLKVGPRPLLETILASFIDYRFNRFYISVNYKAEMVKEHFGDGSAWGCEIRYLQEPTRLGTAGALSLIEETPVEPMIVMNGDLLTNVNFESLLEYHKEQSADATACIREYEFQVPYGVVNTDGHRITSIDEKPVTRVFVNAGIYVLSPSCLQRIKKGGRLDMTTLIEELLAEGRPVGAFPICEYWLDVGLPDDLHRAKGDIEGVFPDK